MLSGLEAALWDKPRRGGLPNLDERGRHFDRPGVLEPTRGTHLLDDAVVDRRAPRSPGRASHLGRNGTEGLKEGLKPWLQEHWCIPEVSPSFVADMGDVLNL